MRLSVDGRRSRLLTALLVGIVMPPTFAAVLSYEGVALPDPPWERIATSSIERRVENGWLIQTIEHGQDFYRMPLTAFVGQ